jgi:hypothetical protein
VDTVSKNEIIERIEYILSYLLSRKHNADVKIYFKKEKITNGYSDTSGDIGKEQILD